MAVATEDPIEALESLKAFRSASLTALVFDELGRTLEPEDLEKFIKAEQARSDRQQ